MKKILFGVILGILIGTIGVSGATNDRFLEGFSAGVRYGLLAYRDNPEEDSIPALEKKAMAIYLWITTVDPKEKP